MMVDVHRGNELACLSMLVLWNVSKNFSYYS